MIKKLGNFFRYKDEKRLLIYQMGKVGSSTLEDAMPYSIHLHTLYCQPNFDRTKIEGVGFLGLTKIRCFVKTTLCRIMLKSRKKIKIITAFRDPFERDYSMFFQDLPYYLQLYSQLNGLNVRGEEPGYLHDVFHRTYDISYGLTWFDRELHRFTGIDVYEYPFDSKKGYTNINKGRYEVLLLDSTKIADNVQAISDFCGDTLQLKNKNRSDHKWYASAYADFKSEFSPSNDYRAIVNQSKYYSHFFN